MMKIKQKQFVIEKLNLALILYSSVNFNVGTSM